MSDGQIQPLNKGGVEPSCQTQSLQGGHEISGGSKAHHVRHANQLSPLVAFLDLTVDQPRRHLPSEDFAPSTSHFSPLAKMSRQRVEVHL